MDHYQLQKTTMGVHQEHTRLVAISVPAGAVLRVPNDFANSSGFVQVDWDGISVQLFAVDLRDRGQLIKAQSA
jgi:hypothetical protein